MVSDRCYIAEDPAAIFKEVRNHLQRVSHKVLSTIHGNPKKVSREELADTIQIIAFIVGHIGCIAFPQYLQH
jgi:hypothetical protein